MSEPKRDTSLQIALHLLTVQPAPAGKYGISFRGGAPPVVSDVAAGSAAEQGGLKPGDFILRINSTDVLMTDTDDVLSLLNQCGGRGVSVCVARPRPVPTTDVERRRALIAMQSKLDRKAIDSKLGQDKYMSALSGAQQSAMGILETLKTEGEREEQQTVQLELYDSDSLASPPDSSGGEEEEEGEEGKVQRGMSDDPLLDFSRDDSLTHVPGRVTAVNKEGPRDVAQASKLPLSKPPPVVVSLPSNSSSNKPANPAHGSSPTKSPSKASQFFPPALQSASSKAHPPVVHTMSDKPAGSKAPSDVILRQRKKDGAAGMGAPPTQLSQKSLGEVELGDIASIEVACKQLPRCVRDWSRDDVQTWLQQLNTGLHSLYCANFANHDITGPSLLRLSEDRLTDMGITTQKHRYLLALLIAMLRVRQEGLEIRELVAGSEDLDTDDEELEMTYL